LSILANLLLEKKTSSLVNALTRMKTGLRCWVETKSCYPSTGTRKLLLQSMVMQAELNFGVNLNPNHLTSISTRTSSILGQLDTLILARKPDIVCKSKEV